jgi:V/A-type H+-transporting ATPase subunit A
VPLRAVLDGGLPARLLRLGSLPAAEVGPAATALGEALEAALSRLEAE